MKLSEVAIVSDRLRQGSITPEYTEYVFLNFTKDVTIYMYPKPADDISETKAFVDRAIAGMEAGSNLQLIILNKETNEFLGCSGLHSTNSGKPELGIWLKPSAHGRGYGLEAIGAIIGWAKDNVEYEYIKYPVDVRNVASKRIPEHYGGVVKDRYKATNATGAELDLVEYWIYPE